MSASGEGLGRILTVALRPLLGVFNGGLHRGSGLKGPLSKPIRRLDLKRNILMAAGLLDPSMSVEEQFEQVENSGCEPQ